MQIKNKLFFLSALVLVAGAGCAKPYIQPPERQSVSVTSTEGNVDAAIYTSDELGVRFQYPKEAEGRLTENGNEIRDPQWGESGFIRIFDKTEDESIEAAIEKIITAEGKNPKNCVVKKNGISEDGVDMQYMIVLASTTPEILYTQEEKDRIKKADETAKKDGGPFGGETEKQVIYNEKLVAACSIYAQPSWPATSKNIGAWFMYNPVKSTTKFVYMPATADPYFFDTSTIEFTK